MKRDFYVQGSEDGEPNWQPRLTSAATTAVYTTWSNRDVVKLQYEQTEGKHTFNNTVTAAERSVERASRVRQRSP